MAVGNVVGRAYIEIHADSSPFAKELGVEVEAIAQAIEPKSGKAGEKIGEDVKQGVKKSLKKDAKSLFKDLFSAVTDLFGGGGNSSQKTTFERRFLKFGKDLGGIFTNGLQQGLKGAVGLIGSIGSSVGNVGSGGPLGVIFGVAILTLIPALVALVSQFAALVNVLFLLPGAASAALFAILPLVVAFHGFSDAISAIMSGDPKQINEALKALSPSARKVAQDFQKLLPFLHQLKTVAQESFFKPLIGDLPKLQKVLGPTILSGFKLLAGDAGNIVNQFLKLFTTPSAVIFFQSMFALADSFEKSITPGVLALTNGLMSVSVGTGPELQKIGEKIGDGLNKFGNWLDQISKNGQLHDFMDKLNNALDKLKQLGTAGWNLIQALIGSTDRQNAADTLFNDIMDCINTLTDFFKSEDGKKGMQQLITDAGLLLKLFTGILGLVVNIAAWIQDIVEDVEWLTGKQHLQAVLGTVKQVPDNNNTTPRDRGFATGGVVAGAAWRMTGEAGPEAIIPLTDKGRAQQLLDQSGLSRMFGQGDTHVTVMIGNDQLEGYVMKTTAKGIKALARGVKNGPRLTAVGA